MFCLFINEKKFISLFCHILGIKSKCKTCNNVYLCHTEFHMPRFLCFLSDVCKKHYVGSPKFVFYCTLEKNCSLQEWHV